VKDDISWELFQSHVSRDQSEVFLSATERLVQEEKALAHNESNVIKSTAMGVLPFEFTGDVKSQLQKFNTDESSDNWVELRLESETVQLADSKSVEDIDSMPALVNQDEPRFILLRKKASDGAYLKFFIFSCPENAPIRVKMTMSSRYILNSSALK
jgi:hypothetical protein